MSKKEMKKDNDRRCQQLFRTRTPAWSYATSAKTLTSVSVWIALIDPRKIQNSEMSDSLKEGYAECSAFPRISGTNTKLSFKQLAGGNSRGSWLQVATPEMVRQLVNHGTKPLT